MWLQEKGETSPFTMGKFRNYIVNNACVRLGLWVVTVATPFVFPPCDFGIELTASDLQITSVVFVISLRLFLLTPRAVLKNKILFYYNLNYIRK